MCRTQQTYSCWHRRNSMNRDLVTMKYNTTCCSTINANCFIMIVVVIDERLNDLDAYLDRVCCDRYWRKWMWNLRSRPKESKSEQQRWLTCTSDISVDTWQTPLVSCICNIMSGRQRNIVNHCNNLSFGGALSFDIISMICIVTDVKMSVARVTSRNSWAQ